MSKTILLVVNFGGPRNLEEVESFLEELLTDKDVIRTILPSFLQDYLFRTVAKKRAPIVASDYAEIGGGSPIYEDTEWMAKALEKELNLPTITFHRYLKQTHQQCVESICKMDPDKILVFPLFPQFSFATTGSIARWFGLFLPRKYTRNMEWVKSYFFHEGFLGSYEQIIRECLAENHLKEEETKFLFSAHGVPLKFIQEGDPYERECVHSFRALARRFSNAVSQLAFQSKFGRGAWLEPSTKEVCEKGPAALEGKKNIVFVPLSFSSDHIETLFEIEELYVKPLREQGVPAFRCKALGKHPLWVIGAKNIICESPLYKTCELIRD